jgi:hypothetical protein
MTAYLSLQVADEQTLEDLTRLVAVADIFKGLCRVLAAYVEEDFLTTAVFTLSALFLDDSVCVRRKIWGRPCFCLRHVI